MQCKTCLICVTSLGTCPDLVTKSFVACGQVENVHLKDISCMKPGRPLKEAKPGVEFMFKDLEEEDDNELVVTNDMTSVSEEDPLELALAESDVEDEPVLETVAGKRKNVFRIHGTKQQQEKIYSYNV